MKTRICRKNVIYKKETMKKQSVEYRPFFIVL